jgi:hypothetical protein
MEVDVAAVADPDTGVAVYCSDCGASHQGWQIMGGTSAAAPLVAAAFTALGLAAVDPSFPSSHAADFFDIVQGSNGTCDSPSFCNAGSGYDGPTGWGTLNGTLLASASAHGTSGAQVDAGESVVKTAGTSEDAGTEPIADAGRDTDVDAMSRVPSDAGSCAADDAGSHADSDAKSDAGAVERVESPTVPEASADAAAAGEGPVPTVAGALECSLRVRPPGRTQISELALASIAALAVARRRRRGG